MNPATCGMNNESCHMNHAAQLTGRFQKVPGRGDAGKVPAGCGQGRRRLRPGSGKVAADFGHGAGCGKVPEGSGRAPLLRAATLRFSYAHEASQQFRLEDCLRKDQTFPGCFAALLLGDFYSLPPVALLLTDSRVTRKCRFMIRDS